jgi:hypothetical protein
MEIRVPETLKMRSWPSLQVLYSKQATCIADFFTWPLTAVCRIWGLDVVREFTWAGWAIRTPDSQVKLSGNILESICIKPNSSHMFTPICLSRKVQGLQKKQLAIRCFISLYNFCFDMFCWQNFWWGMLKICAENTCIASFKACCCCCCCCCCCHLVKTSTNFSEMLLTTIKVHVDRWMCAWMDTKKWRR